MSKNPDRDLFGIGDDEFLGLAADEVIIALRDSAMVNAVVQAEAMGRCKAQFGVELADASPEQADNLFANIMTEVTMEVLSRFLPRDLVAE